MANYHIDNKTPQYLEEFNFHPVLFNKGGSQSDRIRVELISKNTEVEILDEPKLIHQMESGAIHQKTSFRLRSLNPHLRKSDLKLLVEYDGRNDWSGAMRTTSQVFISPDCPPGHKIRFYGEYDVPYIGDIPRDNQGAHSFITKTRYVYFDVLVSE